MARESGTGRLMLVGGLGDGTLKPAKHVNSGWQGMREIIGAGDFTGDGKPDLLAVRADNNVMYTYPGNGTGGWLTPRVVTAGWGGFDAWIGVGDVTGDAKADLLARRSSDGALVLYSGTGAGTLNPGRVVLSGWDAFRVVVG
jgi:hypothetical protein